MNIGYIYVLTSPSGKHYVGQSWNINQRFNSYKTLSWSCKEQPKLYNALKKYGPENFEFYIISSAYTQKDLDDKECYWIGMYDSQNNKYGYNLKSGGARGKHSQETKLKMSIASKGKQKSKKHIKNMSLSRKGKRQSKEAVEKRRISNTGKVRSLRSKQNISNGRIGIIFSESHRKNIGKRHKGKILSSETKEKISKNHASKIYVYTIINILNNETVITDNLKQFCTKSNLNPSSILWCIENNRIYKKKYKVTRIKK